MREAPAEWSFLLLDPDRREEPEAFDVVKMQVREKDMQWSLMAAAQREPERTDAGSSVEHRQRIVGKADLEAGGVAAACDRVRPWSRQGAAATPDHRLRTDLPEEQEHSF